MLCTKCAISISWIGSFFPSHHLRLFILRFFLLSSHTSFVWREERYLNKNHYSDWQTFFIWFSSLTDDFLPIIVNECLWKIVTMSLFSSSFWMNTTKKKTHREENRNAEYRKWMTMMKRYGNNNRHKKTSSSTNRLNEWEAQHI